MSEKVLIIDFGSQYTQLIARRVRELNIYCEIHPFNKIDFDISSYKAIILSGSPFSVRSKDALHIDLINFKLLNFKEKKYLFDYHLNVYNKISRYLNKNEKKWLINLIK